MITLSDYLFYMHQEFLDARRRADESAIETAKIYADHPYLQHFKAPRFVMPVIKLQIPIKIDAIDHKAKYDFKFDGDAFLSDLNALLKEIEEEYNIALNPMQKEVIVDDEFQALLGTLEENDHQFVREIEHLLPINNVEQLYGSIYPTDQQNTLTDYPDSVKEAIQEAFYQALKRQYTLVASNLNHLYIAPQVGSLSSNESEKLLINLDVEMIEEGFVIRNVEDGKGNKVEELIVD